MHKLDRFNLGRYFTLAMASALLAPVAAHAFLDTPAADVFGSEAKIENKTARGLMPYQCPEMPKDDEELQVMQAVHIALCNNPTTRASWFQLRSQAISLNSTKVSEWIPDVDVSTSLSQTYTRQNSQTDAVAASSASASIGYTIFNFGVREATVEAAEKSLESAMTSYDSALQGLIATTLNNYYSVLTAQYNLDAAKDSLLFAEESLNAAQTRYELGLVARADVLQAQAGYSSAVVSLEQAENSLQQANNSLMTVMGLEPQNSLNIADVSEASLVTNDLDVRVQDLVELAKQERKDLRSQEQSLASSQASLRATKRGNLPSVSMSASQSYSDIDIFNRDTPRTGTLGFSVSIPIFSGFTRSYTIKSTEQSIKAQKLGIEATKLSIVEDVWSAYNNYKTAEQSWVSSFDALASASEFRDITLGRYKEGVGSLLDMQSAQSAYSSAQSSYISSRFALLTSRVDLIRAVGVLDLKNAAPEASFVGLR